MSEKKHRKKEKKAKKAKGDLDKIGKSVKKMQKMLRKLKKDNKRLEKELKSSEKKRKREHSSITAEKREIRREKKKAKEHSQQTSGSKAGVSVHNPFTGKSIKIKDGSYTHNRPVRQYILQWEREQNQEAKKNMFDKLTQMFAEAISKGHTEFDTKSVPVEIINAAADLHKERTGEDVTVEVHSTSTSGVSENEEMPVETFNGKFEKYVIDMKDYKNESFYKDLQQARGKALKILYQSARKHKSFRYYILLHVLMGRGTGTVDENGKVQAAEERIGTISSNASGGNNGMEIIRKTADIKASLSTSYTHLVEGMSNFDEQGSGFVFIRNERMEIYVSEFVAGVSRSATSESSSAEGEKEEDVREKVRSSGEGSSEDLSDNPEKGGSWVPGPAWTRNRHGLINMKPAALKTDQRCFEWSILRGLHPTGGYAYDTRDLQQYVGKELVLPHGVTYPIPIDDKVFWKIEELNDYLSFSVFHIGQETDDVRPLYVSGHKDLARRNHIQLGLISENGNNHFVLIKDMSKLLPTSRHKRRYFCENCMSAHQTPDNLKAHEEICGKNEPCRIRMPEPGSKDQFIVFKSWQYLLPVEFVIYADFEAVKLKQEDGRIFDVVSGFSYHIVSKHKGIWPAQLFKIRHHIGEDSMDEFFKQLFADGEKIKDLVFNTHKDLVMTKKDQDAYDNAKICHICRKDLNGDKKVRDHDHFTGKFRGAAHMLCNSKYTSKLRGLGFNIPVVFHNGRGYDFYHILQGVKTRFNTIKKLEVVALNMEKFRSITIDTFRFIDSIQFVNGSLEKQVENLVKETPKKNIPVLFKPVLDYLYQLSKKVLGKSTRSQRTSWAKKTLPICTGKGIYPYEWVDSYKKMEATSLPEQKDFFSELRNEGITDEEYKKARQAWKVLGCRTFGDYTRIYCDLDVLLLEIIFELFRDSSIAERGGRLDPAHFLTAPSLSWNSMLLMNHAKDIVIENMTDVDMLLMVEDGIRGGQCQVMCPYAKSNVLSEKEVEENASAMHDEEYDDTLRDIRLLYLDANNLYGWAMMEELPEGDYRWERYGDMSTFSSSELILSATTKRNRQAQFLKSGFDAKKEWAEEDVDKLLEYILSLDPKGQRGYILEVDIQSNQECHDELNNYPMLPERKTIEPSDFTKQQIANMGLESIRTSKTQKLVMDLTPKKNYVIHLRNLHQALEKDERGNRRYKVTRIGRIISFRQSRWLAAYIDSNTQMRKGAKNPIEKDFYKLKNNAIFGKTMEQVRKRRNVKFFMKKDLLKAVRQASSPYVKSWRVIAKDELMLMEMAKHEVVMDRPVALGFCILEHSKRRMFDFYYNEMKCYIRDEDLKVLYTDTDSLIVEVKAPLGHTVNSILVRMQKDLNCFDCSEFKNKDHPLITEFTAEEINKNAKVPGLFKVGGMKISCF